jgi:hypothetical protein
MAESLPGLERLQGKPAAPADEPLPGMGRLQGGAPGTPREWVTTPATESVSEAPWYGDPTGLITVPGKIAAPLGGLLVAPVAKVAGKVGRGVAPALEALETRLATAPGVQAMSKAIQTYVTPHLKDIGTELAHVGGKVQQVLSPATVSPEARETAGMMRDRLGHMALDSMRAEATLQTARQATRKFTPEQTTAFIDWIEQGRFGTTAGLPITPELRAAGTAIRDMLNQRAQQVQDLGTGALPRLIQNYFPHMWEKPDPATLKKLQEHYGWLGGMLGSEDFLKRRMIQYYKDGVALGLKPRVDNPVDMVLLKVREMDRYIMGTKVFQELQEKGLARPFTQGTVPEGWTKIPDLQALIGPGPVGKGTTQQWYAPNDAARIMTNYLSPGLQDFKTYNVLRSINNNMNAASLGFSAFHVTAEAFNTMMSQVALGLQQVGRGELGRGASNIGQGMLPTAVVRSALQGSKVLQAARTPGAAGEAVDTVVDMLAKGGMRFEANKMFINSAAGNFWEAMKHAPVSESLRRISAPIMEKLVPMLKAGVAFDLAEDALRRLPPDASQATIRHALGRVVDTVDNRLGLLTYDNLFWKGTLRDLGFLSTRALGWNLGTIRELGGGGVDWLTNVAKALHGQPSEVTERMGYTMALPFVAGLYGSMAHYLRTGQRPENTTDRFFPGPPGEKWALPTYMGDVVKYKEDPARTVWGKASPLAHTTVELFTNKDWRGAPIRTTDPDDPLFQQLLTQTRQVFQHIGEKYVPFTARAISKDWADNPTQAVLDFFGVTKAPAARQRTDEEQEAVDARTRRREQRLYLKSHPQSQLMPGEVNAPIQTTGNVR